MVGSGTTMVGLPMRGKQLSRMSASGFARERLEEYL